MSGDMTGEKSTIESKSSGVNGQENLPKQLTPQEKIQQLREHERAKRLAKLVPTESTGSKLDDLMVKGTIADLEDQTSEMNNTLTAAIFYRFILPVIATIFALQLTAFSIFKTSMADLAGSQVAVPVIIKVSLIALPICAAAIFICSRLIRNSGRIIWWVFYGASMIITAVLLFASVRTLTVFFMHVLKKLR
jgi:hypothetical protein